MTPQKKDEDKNMTTDCPNCSWKINANIHSGMNVKCPFCGETFEYCGSPFEQLRKFMVSQHFDSEHSLFWDCGYPNKNHTGWLIHRIQLHEKRDVVLLMNEFHSDIEHAKQKVDDLWTFDFSPYLNTDSETIKEIRALWLRARFATHARPEESNVCSLFLSALWTRKITLTPEWENTVLSIFEKEWQDSDPESRNDEPISKSDLVVTMPENNPLFDWAASAPIAIRERLNYALTMSGYGLTIDEEQKYKYQFKLDRAAETRWGADFGYASTCLLESNIFCDPLPETWYKLFSKDEFFSFLEANGIPVKKNYNRKRMLELLLAVPNGLAWFEEQIHKNKFIRLHPTLAKYNDEIRSMMRPHYRLMEAISKIPIPGKRE